MSKLHVFDQIDKAIPLLSTLSSELNVDVSLLLALYSMDNDFDAIFYQPQAVIQYHDLTRPEAPLTYCYEDERRLNPSSSHFSVVKRCNVVDGKGEPIGQQVAVKMLKARVIERDLDSEEEDSWQIRMSKRLKREWTIHGKLNHRNVARLIGSFEIPTQNIWYLVTPWYRNGTIRVFLRKRQEKRFSLLYEAAQGLSYLHSENVVHGDIKSTNVLIDNGGHAVIIDFGVSFMAIPPPQQLQSSNIAEAPQWLAPELQYPYTARVRSFSSDIWAFGCLTLEVYADRNPFDDVPRASVSRYLNAENENSRLLPGSPERYPEVADNDALWQFCNRCWERDPAIRPTIQDVIGFFHITEGLTRAVL
ncbi:hypothetical protein FRC03_002246 [Tulasnella sp. 419]|nr:hypothetical protein FRC03_002246 [Tulasnella sp. 419]